jgi:hypothetical protein
MANARTRIGRFEIQTFLAQGTRGEIYLGRDPNLGRQVVIKTIPPGSDFTGETHARFQREARAIAALDHPNILALYDFGLDDGVEYLAMEYLEGEDLGTLIAQRKLGRALLLESLAQACEGLAYAHDLGIVHRNVKPANVQVTLRAGQLQAKLSDFMGGLAPSAQQSFRDGRLGYQAPEYLASGKATPSADLFAMGVILYEILSEGRQPFAGETPSAMLNAMLHSAPAPLDLPEGLMTVAIQALDKDPEARFANGDDLAAAIRRALTASAAAPQASKAQAAPPIVVGRGAPATCLSLRVALRQAQPGATILVLPGSYKEAIVVTREVTIQGEGEAAEVVLGSGLTVGAGGTLTLINATVNNPQGVALRLLPGAGLEAKDCCFQDAPGGGAELGPGSGSSFLRCWFTGNACAGLLALGGSQTFLEDCEVSSNGDAGVHACGAANVHLRFSRLMGNAGMGVSAVDGASVSMDHCSLGRNQGPAVLLERGGTGQLSHCMLTGGLSLGIACRKDASVAMDDCQVEGNAVGGILVTPEAQPFKVAPGNRVLDPVIRSRPHPSA